MQKLSDYITIEDTCKKCGKSFRYQKKRVHGGKYREYCTQCVPEDQRERKRLYSTKWNKERRKKIHKRREKVSKPAPIEEVQIEKTICGCGRDYLTVPLEESHICIAPIKDARSVRLNGRL